MSNSFRSRCCMCLYIVLKILEFKVILLNFKSPYSQYIACVVVTKALTRNTVVLNPEDKFKLS